MSQHAFLTAVVMAVAVLSTVSIADTVVVSFFNPCPAGTSVCYSKEVEVMTCNNEQHVNNAVFCPRFEEIHNSLRVLLCIQPFFRAFEQFTDGCEKMGGQVR